jgi:hypothetical protein
MGKSTSFPSLPAGNINDAIKPAFSQWGNLLVLAACFESDILRQEIDKDVLRALFNRTIDFLQLVGAGEGALETDLGNLSTLAKQLFSDGLPSAGRDFSSPPPPLAYSASTESGPASFRGVIDVKAVQAHRTFTSSCTFHASLVA